MFVYIFLEDQNFFLNTIFTLKNKIFKISAFKIFQNKSFKMEENSFYALKTWKRYKICERNKFKIKNDHKRINFRLKVQTAILEQLQINSIKIREF